MDIDGEAKDAHGTVVDNIFLLCYYFNIGLDARVGFNLEKHRTGSRCCNYFMYAVIGIWDIMNQFCCCKKDHGTVNNHVKRVVSYRQMRDGVCAPKVTADVANFKTNPINIVGNNIPQGYGGFLDKYAWGRSQDRLADPQKHLRKRGVGITTSCDESDSKLEQRMDDDKMELMCQETHGDYINFDMTRLG